MYIHMDSGNMILFRKAKDDIHEETEDVVADETAEPSEEDDEVDETVDAEEDDDMIAEASSGDTANRHALEMSHNEILEALYWMWKKNDVQNPEFNRLCIVYKNRFGEDPTVGMLDLVEKHIRWGDAKPLSDEDKERLIRLMT